MKTSIITLILLTALTLTSCSSSTPIPATPTAVDIQALQTQAVATIFASYTQTAQAQPTLTSTPVPAVPTETSTPSPTASPTQSFCDDSAYINDSTITDGSVMSANEEFVKTWKVKNTGTCSWGAGYKIVFAYGVRMNGDPVLLPKEIMPGESAEISINLTAPAKTGNYSGFWILANTNNVVFGQRLSVIIVIP